MKPIGTPLPSAKTGAASTADIAVGAGQGCGLGGRRGSPRQCGGEDRAEGRSPIEHAPRQHDGFRRAWIDVHQHIQSTRRRIAQRGVIHLTDHRARIAGFGEDLLGLRNLAGADVGDPGGENEVGAERVDRNTQRLQCVRVQGLVRADQAHGDAGEQLPLGETLLDQAGMIVDAARQRGLLDRDFLLVYPKRDQPGYKQADQGDQSNDESQPNQATTLNATELWGEDSGMPRIVRPIHDNPLHAE
jgi:hypothetical protein